VAYLDNILIYLDTLEEHKMHVTKIIKALEKSRMKIQKNKCVFHMQEVEFLEFIIRIDDIKINSKKIEAVKS
jgi:Reverse transcriptase (RNA-dependent DNA polymerase)